MHDTQQSVTDYYAATASGGDLGRSVRAFLVSAQTLNDLFSNAVADAVTYKAILSGACQAESDLINAVKYARNVDQHVLHIIRPDDETHTLVGGTFGMRMYAFWDEIPARAHAQLRKSTQALKPAYEAALQGQEVTGTMLELLRFYARIAPTIVHRDHHGEWSGFPLMSQPGMPSPLHPEEPGDVERALDWLSNRRPGGDARLICGQFSLDGTPHLYGHTFVGRYSFAPWIDSAEQVNIDIGLGYVYLKGSLEGRLIDVSSRFPEARQGGVLMSHDEMKSWATPIARVDDDDDWCGDTNAEIWERYVRLERGELTPAPMAYGLRRARRLNALVPPSARLV